MTEREKYVQIDIAGKGDAEWDEIYQAIIDNSYICKGIVVSNYIESVALPNAECIMAAYAPDPDPTNEYMNMYGLLIGNWTEYPGLFYVDVVCSLKAGIGAKLIEAATEYAKKQGLLGVKLASLAHVIGFYRKLGYRARETCFEQENDALRIAYKMYAEPFVQKWGRDSVNHLTDTDELAEDYRSYLDLLIGEKLAKNKNCKKVDECNSYGYLMTTCFNDMQVGAGRPKRKSKTRSFRPVGRRSPTRIKR